MLEKQREEGGVIEELPLFAAAVPKEKTKRISNESTLSEIESELRALQVDFMTPREALESLYRLKSKLDEL
jgi:DNA mismatch repair protein MutS